MDVIIDGERNFRFQGEPGSIMEALAAVNDFLHEKGRAMLALKVDGRNISSEQLAEGLRGVAPQNVTTLEVATGLISSLVKECLDQLQQSVGELPGVCTELARVFHSEHPDDGFEPFHQLAHIWSTIKSRQGMVVNTLGLNLEELRVDSLSLRDMHDELNGVLEEAAQALENGDCVLLGDLLEYELAPRAERERSIVAFLLQHAPVKSS